MSAKHEVKAVPSDRLNPLQLERLVRGELTEQQARLLEKEVGIEEIERRRRSLEADDAVLLQRFPPERLVPEIERRLNRAQECLQPTEWQNHRVRILAWSATLASVAILAVAAFVWVGNLDHRSRSGSIGEVAENTIIKGLDIGLRVYRKLPGLGSGSSRSERLDEGTPVVAGDEIQLGYIAAGQRHGVILSIDGSGAITLHYPEDPEQTTLLENEGEGVLQHSFRLDDAPGFERFFFVTSPEPIVPMLVLQRARLLAHDPGRAQVDPLDLPEEFEQVSFTLRKETP